MQDTFVYQPIIFYPKKSYTDGLKREKHYWKTIRYPSIEITTSVPKGGCTVDCLICPQKLLLDTYHGDRHLKLDDFKRLLDKIPQEINIIFSGFVEPWLNKHATDMVYYAHEKGHGIAVYTTGIGMHPEDVDRLTKIPYYWDATNGVGGFCLHLPDAEGVGRHPITPLYIKTLERIAELREQIPRFSCMSMGRQIHPTVAHLFPKFWYPEFFGRAGNLTRELKLKPDLAKFQHVYKDTPVSNTPRTCGCIEHLYHNVLLPNGDVSLCCMDYGQDHIIGNLFEQDFDDIMPPPNSTFDICKSCHMGVSPI
jgi:hypothetical protein